MLLTALFFLIIVYIVKFGWYDLKASFLNKTKIFLSLINSLNRMKTTFLDYYKMILEKVSFSKELLIKEYQKALRTLEPKEAGDLNHWIKMNGLHHQLQMEKIKQKNQSNEFL